MKVNHAILHILDFESAVNVFSQRELDLDTRTVRSFVTSHLRRARTSGDNKRGSFSENSAFAGELRSYFFGERDFIDLSLQIAEFVSAELAKAEKAESTDVFVADFEDDDGADVDDSAHHDDGVVADGDAVANDRAGLDARVDALGIE